MRGMVDSYRITLKRARERERERWKKKNTEAAAKDLDVKKRLKIVQQ